MSTLDAVHEAAGFTGRFTAGLRYVESTCVSDPLISSDPLAGVLAGDRGLALAKRELEQLSRDQVDNVCNETALPTSSARGPFHLAIRTP